MENPASNPQIALEIVENSPSLAMRLRGPNGAWETLFMTGNIINLGYAPGDFLAGGLSWGDVIHPEDKALLFAQMERYAGLGIDQYAVNYRVVNKQGKVMWMTDSTTVARNADGSIAYIDCVVNDYTALRQSQQLAEKNLTQHHVLGKVMDLLQAKNVDKVFPKMLGLVGEHLGVNTVALFEDNAAHTMASVVSEWAAEPEKLPSATESATLHYGADIPEIKYDLDHDGQCVVNYDNVPPGLMRKFGKYGITAGAFFPVYKGDERYGFIAFVDGSEKRVFSDDTVAFLANIARLASTALMRISNEESIVRVAYHDRLTGLTNRYLFEMYTEQAISEARLAGESGYVLFIDMDDFKVINEGYGHDYGDGLLVAVADYLKGQYGDCCRLFRFGGDEFTILLNSRHADMAQDIVDELLARARHPWVVGEQEFYCTLSLGVVRFPEGGSSVTEVTKNADIAMYQAKSEGKNSYVYYNDSLDNSSRQRAETEHRMRASIENAFEGFCVHYQPQVDLAGTAVGAEALVRWADNEGKLIPPGQFIPLAEYLGLIVPLGEFVLRQAAHLCYRINQVLPSFTISVNVSIRQFQQPNFINRVESILAETGVEPGNMVLEVTEGLLAQNLERMRQLLEQLRGLGLKIAMDDFGTGYSSLNNMRRLPLDIIKIDRSFIRDVTGDAYSKSFIHLISDLVHSMGRTVCVEGVETVEQYRYCSECRVDTIQGFYFFRPVPEGELVRRLLPAVEPVAVSQQK